jgi:hypothetical protein
MNDNFIECHRRATYWRQIQKCVTHKCRIISDNLNRGKFQVVCYLNNHAVKKYKYSELRIVICFLLSAHITSGELIEINGAMLLFYSEDILAVSSWNFLLYRTLFVVLALGWAPMLWIIHHNVRALRALEAAHTRRRNTPAVKCS